MRRRPPPGPVDRPPIPDRLRRYVYEEWITTADRLPTGTEEDAAAHMVKVYRRWQTVRTAWAIENDYSAHEMYRAAHPETTTP